MSRLPALAIETSGRVGSVAVVLDGVVLAEEEFPHGLQHAARIIPVCDSLCAAHGLKPADLRELYISIGPGSFTGLRVGITMAKTLAFATGLKLVAVPSVRVLASNAPAEARNLVIVLDAKREQIFTARFERVDAQWIEREPAHLDRLAEVVARSPRPVHLLGEGLPYHQQFLNAADMTVIQTPPECWRARAAAVAASGWEMAREGRFTEANDLLPLYVRVPEAEEKWKAEL